MNNDGRQDSFLYKPLVRLAIALGILLAVAVVIGYVRLGLRWYLSPTNDLSITQRKDLVQGLASMGQALAVGLTGAAAFIGLAFTWRNLRETRESTQRTLELAEQGQITDSLTRAIELLGATTDGGKKVLEARIGAVYALERIARESEEYYWPSMEILASYVRNAAQKLAEAPEHDFWIGHAQADIQAIIDVFGQRTGRWENEESRRINLSGTDLRNADFTYGNFTGVWFLNADLRGANFRFSDLRGTFFADADLRYTFFTNVENLTDAHFEGANLEGTMFHAVNLAMVHDLTQDQIEQAEGDEHTKLPDGLARPAHWSVTDIEPSGD